MADNRQTAYVLSLAGGIVALLFALLFLLILLVAVGGVRLAMGPHMGGPEGLFLAVMGAMGFLFVGVGVATGIVLLVAAPRLRSEDEAVRRAWSTWAIVAGALNLFGAGFISGILGVAAGVITLMDLQRQAPSAPAP